MAPTAQRNIEAKHIRSCKYCKTVHEPKGVKNMTGAVQGVCQLITLNRYVEIPQERHEQRSGNTINQEVG